MRYLLDTCLISELIRPKPDPGVIGWLGEREEERLFLSVLTLGELQKGISKLDPSPRRDKLQGWVEMDLSRRFQGRLLPVDAEVAVTWGHLQGESERRGERLPVVDSLLAATALAHNLIVVTRNTKDLAKCQVQIINPWEE